MTKALTKAPRPASHGVGIRAIGGHVPSRVVTNADLEKSLETTDAWISEHIGITTRRWSGPDERTSDLGAAALLDACARAGVDPDSIDLLICGTFTPDHMLPAAAVAIARKLGLSGVPGFDVNSGGCPGGTFALDVGAKYLMSGQYRRIAVVLADTTTKTLDPEDRTVGVIFGDAAACYLLEPCAPGTGMTPALLRSDPSAYETAFIKREERTWSTDGSGKLSGFGNNFMHMHGRSVRNFALDTMPNFVLELLEHHAMTVDDIDLIIFHQANYHLIHLLMEKIGLPADRTLTNVERLGNTSGAGVPLVLREAVDSGRVKPGDTVVLASFGAGMSHGGTVIKWTAEDDFLAPVA
ncbi:ketoacyl-ACP synthase III [Streptomyces canus]|uniref:3-oxoacyl-ACP synthase III family protein n=1 Tax=Streptomyces canus TaxID=58343 RepID=UPI002252B71F|nr:ketoacyl-ACP synthase III [Streptomyces canus]MCX5258357.1 ketoacyl-ACP synthase III [Streptomyces canus]